MAAYNTVDGVPCHASERLLTDLLRDEWGFDGTVVSDRQAAGVCALAAGVDVERVVDRAARRHLRQKVRAGLFTDPAPDPDRRPPTAASRVE